MDEQTYHQPIYQQSNWNSENNQQEPQQWLAIASFVLSLVGFNILWLIFWIIALNKKQLRWAALAWTIISAVKLALSFFILMWIFAWALIPRISTAHDKAYDVARKQNARTLTVAVMSYSLDNNDKYPSSIENLDLSKYSIPAGNFYGNPSDGDSYNYLQLNNWDHFVIYTDLSCVDCGNCDSNMISNMTDFESADRYTSNTSWGSYCLVY